MSSSLLFKLLVIIASTFVVKWTQPSKASNEVWESSIDFMDLQSMEKCEKDSDWVSQYEHCDDEYYFWVHKGVFPPSAAEILGAFMLLASIALWNAAGIGGGELVVAILIVFFEFSTKSSAVLSNVWIFIASLWRFILNWNQKNPEKNAKSVDYDIIRLMLPVVLLGTFMGVQLNIIIPNTILLIILTVLLIFLSVKTSMKGISMFRKETKNRNLFIDREPEPQPEYNFKVGSQTILLEPNRYPLTDEEMIQLGLLGQNLKDGNYESLDDDNDCDEELDVVDDKAIYIGSPKRK